MKFLLNAEFIVLLFVLVRSADIAISSAIAQSILRAIAYGIVAILALLAVLLVLLAH